MVFAYFSNSINLGLKQVMRMKQEADKKINFPQTLKSSKLESYEQSYDLCIFCQVL